MMKGVSTTPFSFILALMRNLFLLILSCISSAAFSQITPDQAAKALDSFAFMNPQEKVFVHSDRDVFTAGETIWFKTYITLDGQLTNLSKVVYVELANSKGQLVAKRMLHAPDGTAAGEISLPDSLSSGTYALNAYTLWMLNFPQFIFKKHIVVHNYLKEKTRQATASADFSVQFLPEGGNLVAGLESRVAFKAVDPAGMPLKVDGNVVDSKKQVVATITTLHNGMGSFTFTPQANETYSAVVSATNGRSKTVTLPAAMNEGVVMLVNNDNANRAFVQLNRAETNKAKYNQLLIVAQMDHEVVFTGKVDFDAEMSAAAISKKNLPSGILQITAMDMTGLPLAERLVFINNTPASAVQLQLDTVGTSKRKRNYYTLDLSGYNAISASASVVNADAGAALNSENIITSLLLTSDIKGYVHDPGYYFAGNDAGRAKLLDLLLLTQGWRRFNWQNVVKNQHPTLHFPFETGIAIKGKLTGADGKTGVANGKMDLVTKGDDSTTILSTATLNAKNEFAVHDLEFRKSATVFYKGTNVNRQGALVKATFYPSYFDTLTRSKAMLDVDMSASNQLTEYWNMVLSEKQRVDSSQGKTLAAVTVTGKKRSPTDSLNRLYASEIFHTSDQTLMLDPKSHYADIWQFLNRSIPGITIRNTDEGKLVYFTRYEGLDLFSENGPPRIQFFLNESPVPVEIIDGLHPDDVGLVKVFKQNAAVLGADRGAIAVYTKKGGSLGIWRSRGFESFTISGYSVTREFYHPAKEENNIVSDRRVTLYWNPELKQDASGKAVISFYNDDFAKKFTVVVQGIDKNGKLLSLEKVVE
jgi:hypothetical protein